MFSSQRVGVGYGLAVPEWERGWGGVKRAKSWDLGGEEGDKCTFPLDCPSMTSSKGDRTLFAELGGLVVLVPRPRKRLSPRHGTGCPQPLSLSPQAPGWGHWPWHSPSRGFVPVPLPCMLGSSRAQQGGRATCSGMLLGRGGCSWHPLSRQMFSLC